MKVFAKLFTVLFFLLIIGAALLGIDKEYNFFKRESLKDIVGKSLASIKGDYAVVIQNLKTSESYSLNKDKIFQPGSIYKLWVMGTVFELIKQGKLKEDDIISKSIQELNDEFSIESDEAEQTSGTIELTVKQAINQMITISHNYAALLLVSEVGNSKIAEFLKDYGFSKSSLSLTSRTDVPETSASDMALFFEKLYRGEIVDKESSQKMISVLLKQKLNDRIPKYLPKGTKIAHKTGEIDFFKHDAGIVFAPKGDYIIVVLSESKLPEGAVERIASLSKNVYDYFQR